MSTTIYLIRHAEAEGNVYRRCHGIYDAKLTPKAYKQLPYLADRFENVPLDAIYASPLYRARHTAKAIADKKNMHVILRDNLHEIDMGDWEDMPWAEIPVVDAQGYEIWKNRPWQCKIPNGESVMQAGDRVLSELHKIAKLHKNESLVVVSHGSAIRSILCRVLGLNEDKIGEIGWGDNTCVTKLIFEDDDTVHAEYWNDASHLPEELSTFASIGWTNNKGMPSSVQIWFKPYNPKSKDDNELLLSFVREHFSIAYGSDKMLDIDSKLKQAACSSEICPRAVSFGMHDDKPVALVFIDAADNSRHNTCMVASFCINSDYRGSGISQQLIGQAISVCRELNKHYLCALAAQNNARAIGFYNKFGFDKGDLFENQYGMHYLMKKYVYVPFPSEENEYFVL